MAADWTKIRTEYISAPKKVSYRKLAKKYGISESSLFAKASEEQWVEQREQFQSETVAKSLDAISNATVDRASRLMTVADKLLRKVEICVDGDAPISPNAAKNLSDALKNIKEVCMVRSLEDIEEQKARIAKLRREADSKDDEKDKTVIVTIAGGDGSWQK